MTGAAPADVRAQAPPQPRAQLVVPASAGGTLDTVARALADPLQRKLGGTVVVVNMPGAAGRLAAQYVAGAAPPGSALLLVSLEVPALPIAKDFAPVGMIAKGPLLLVVGVSAPSASAADLIARARVGAARVTTAGTGAGLALRKLAATGSRLGEVRAANTRAALNGVIAGETEAAMVYPSPPVLEFIRGRAIRPLAVTSSQRFAALPDVPTLAEQGFKDVIVEQWVGMLAAPGTPAPTIAGLNEALVWALREAEMQARLITVGLVPSPSAPQGLRDFVNEVGGVPICGSPCPAACRDACAADGCCIERY